MAESVGQHSGLPYFVKSSVILQIIEAQVEGAEIAGNIEARRFSF